MKSKNLWTEKIIKDNFWNRALIIMKTWSRWTLLEEKSSWEYKDWRKVWEEEKAVWIIKKGACMIVIQMMGKLDYMVIWTPPLKVSATKRNFRLIKAYPLIILQIATLPKTASFRKIKSKLKMSLNLRKSLKSQKKRIKMWVTSTPFRWRNIHLSTDKQK